MAEDLHFTKQAASIQAYWIKDYWQKQGYEVDVRIQKFTRQADDARYCVRSDLVNGLPKGYKFPKKNGGK